VVTLFDPPFKIGLLNHSAGVTVQQMVTFTCLNRGMTRVAIVMDPIGESTATPPIDVPEALGFFTKDALDTMLAWWRDGHSRP
jgi:hypothetical protein